MKILVTGGAGYIGSHTVVELLNRNYDVVVVDNFCNSKEYVLERIKRITNKNFTFYKVNICNYNEMDKIFNHEKFDCVLHFAALKSGKDSIVDPGKYYENNLNGCYVLTSLMEKYGVKKLVFSSSATVYGNSKKVPIKENDEIGNVISPYGMTKYLAELYFSSRAAQTKKFKVISFRYFNPIGAHFSGLLGEDSPDDVPNNLMLYILKVATKELPFLYVYGEDYNTPDGSGIRDYIHVVDLAIGHVLAIKYFDKMPNHFEAFNLGTGHGYSVFEIIKCFENENKTFIPFKIVGRRPGDVEISYADVRKANAILNWRAKYNLSDCVKTAWKFKQNNCK